MSNKKTTPSLRGTPPKEGNDSPSLKGWQAKPDGVVPRLRFPEFQNAGKWEEKRLGDVCELITKGTTPTTLGFSYEQKGIRFIKIESINGDSQIDVSRTPFISAECDRALARSRLVENDILFSIAGALGVIGKIEKEHLPANTNQALAILRLKAMVLNAFVCHQLRSEHVQIAVEKIKAGAAQFNISLSQLGNFRIYFPEQLEQQKIADCLSSIEDLITAQTQKLNTLKTHKKGLMQQLFPAEGETLPKLRFPEFQDAGEWEENPIGKVAEIVTGNTPSTANRHYYGGDRIFVSPADIGDNRYVTKTKTMLTESGFKETRIVNANSILFVCIGSTIGKIAQNTIDCATNQQINSVIPFDGYSNDFIYSALENNANRIAAIAGNHAVPIINKTAFSNTIILFPSMPEQEKIAGCLSTIDVLIATQTQKLSKLKSHKKALMQQLFPVHENDM